MHDSDFQARSQDCKKRLLASSCLSVGPSVRPHGTTHFHWTDFDENKYLHFFGKRVEKIQVYLKPKKNNGYFT